jgi:hypothetical protein
MNFSCKEQIPGVARIDFYLLSETSNWPIEVTDLTSGSIILTPEINNVDGEIDYESINIDASPKQTTEGTVYPNDINFRFITRSESLEQLMDQYCNQPGIVIGQLNHGFQKIYGTNEEPLYMTWKVDEGQKTTDNAGTIVSIKGETRNRPMFYTP